MMLLQQLVVELLYHLVDCPRLLWCPMLRFQGDNALSLFFAVGLMLFFRALLRVAALRSRASLAR